MSQSDPRLDFGARVYQEFQSAVWCSVQGDPLVVALPPMEAFAPSLAFSLPFPNREGWSHWGEVRGDGDSILDLMPNRRGNPRSDF